MRDINIDTKSMVVISGILPSFVLHTPKTLPFPLKQEPFLPSCLHTHILALTLFPEKGKEKAVNIAELENVCFFSWERPSIFQLAHIWSIK